MCPHQPAVAEQILEFIQEHGVLTVVMTGGIIGCPHQEGIDCESEWCPVCVFWHGPVFLISRNPSWRARARGAAARLPQWTGGRSPSDPLE